MDCPVCNFMSSPTLVRPLKYTICGSCFEGARSVMALMNKLDHNAGANKSAANKVPLPNPSKASSYRIQQIQIISVADNIFMFAFLLASFTRDLQMLWDGWRKWRKQKMNWEIGYPILLDLFLPLKTKFTLIFRLSLAVVVLVYQHTEHYWWFSISFISFKNILLIKGAESVVSTIWQWDIWSTMLFAWGRLQDQQSSETCWILMDAWLRRRTLWSSLNWTMRS